jgi:hypothetical protein
MSRLKHVQHYTKKYTQRQTSLDWEQIEELMDLIL